MANIILWNNNGANNKITAISEKLCPRQLLHCCNVPSEAYSYLPNGVNSILVNENGIFVRGINSSFYLVEYNGEQYYIHEQYIRKQC